MAEQTPVWKYDSEGDVYTEFDFLAVLDDSQEMAVDCGGCVEVEKLPFNLNAQKSKKISNDQELIQSDPTSCPQNQKGNN